MNDHAVSQEMARGSSALMGFMLGAVVGAGAALLLAPVSGAETRKRLGGAAKRLGEGVHDGLGRARSQLADLKDDVRTAIDSGRDAFTQEREGRGRDAGPATRGT
jgi:gas vesicle protein